MSSIIMYIFKSKMQELQDSGEFDTTEDFTLIIEPYLENLDDLSRNVITSLGFSITPSISIS